MAKNKGKDNNRLREKLLINISSRSDTVKEKFTKWINAQSNVQNSILSLIEHSIDRFGYSDVTDHEIAKKLHTEYLYFHNKEILYPKEIVLDKKDALRNYNYEENHISKGNSEEDKSNENDAKNISINPESF